MGEATGEVWRRRIRRRRRCERIYGVHPCGRHRSWRIGGCIGNFEVACCWILVFKLEVLVFVTVGLIQIVMDDLSLPLSIFSRTRVIWI